MHITNLPMVRRTLFQGAEVLLDGHREDKSLTLHKFHAGHNMEMSCFKCRPDILFHGGYQQLPIGWILEQI
jgi:hypothetical protein